jgi:hypothetical protein
MPDARTAGKVGLKDIKKKTIRFPQFIRLTTEMVINIDDATEAICTDYSNPITRLTVDIREAMGSDLKPSEPTLINHRY